MPGRPVSRIRLAVCDLDGTLRHRQNGVGGHDIITLRKLGEQAVCRVIATGRNLLSARRILPPDFPIDYLVFSSGTGIMRWKTQEIIFAAAIKNRLTRQAVEVFQNEKIDFMAHRPIPENHCFRAHLTGHPHPDFLKRCEIYCDYAEYVQYASKDTGAVSQFVAVCSNGDGIFDRIKKQLPGLSVVRTTSPLDGFSLWIEVFAAHVSKGQSLQRLAATQKITPEEIICLGNDYNDHDMLQYAKHSFVTPDAPETLRREFQVIAGEENPLTAACASLGILPDAKAGNY
jgi:hydroxymethylpyrimidine pyrophosphatase-like HAD family hydrolase